MKKEIYNENCLVTMGRMDDNYIDLTITSPPYDNIRKYNGYSFDFQYIAQELYRVTKKGGVLVWVVSDATVKGSETGTSFKQALYFMQCGFKLHDTMIYRSEKPPLTHNRYEQKFEYMFVFSKDKPKTFNPIMEQCKHFGKSRKSTTMRQDSDNTSNRSSKGKIKQFKIKSNVWDYNTGFMQSSLDKIAFKHPAIFPEKLAEDHILSWSNEGDLIYDPFAGSGTTLKMAKLTNRKFIGSEISSEYCEIINKRITNLL